MSGKAMMMALRNMLLLVLFDHRSSRQSNLCRLERTVQAQGRLVKGLLMIPKMTLLDEAFAIGPTGRCFLS